MDKKSSLRLEIQKNQSEIESFKGQVVSFEQIITQLRTKFDDQIKALKESFNKPTNCNLSKALQHNIIKTKNIIATIQEHKFDKKTKDKKSEKLSLKKLDEISFEIIDLKDQINNHIAEHERLQQAVNNIRKNNKDF